jgi:ligand-binding SRPBCC domain-containing protein
MVEIKEGIGTDGLPWVEASEVFPVDRETAFTATSDPRELNAMTPWWFHLRIRRFDGTSDIGCLGEGCRVTYWLHLFGIPLPWRSRITRWEYPNLFTYTQDIGPFRHFEHEHRFEATEGGTRVTDRIGFSLYFARATDRLFVRRMLRSILRVRFAVLRARLVSRSAPSSA